jgi:excisionase family DNA binding protein
MSHIHNSGRRFTSKNDFCRRNHIGHTKFYELLNSGQLRAVKVGSKTLIDEAEEERWKASLPPYEPHSAA